MRTEYLAYIFLHLVIGRIFHRSPSSSMHIKPSFSSTICVFLVPGTQGDIHALIDPPALPRELTEWPIGGFLGAIPKPEWPAKT